MLALMQDSRDKSCIKQQRKCFKNCCIGLMSCSHISLRYGTAAMWVVVVAGEGFGGSIDMVPLGYQCYITLTIEGVSHSTSNAYLFSFLFRPSHVAHLHWPMLYNIGILMVHKWCP